MKMDGLKIYLLVGAILYIETVKANIVVNTHSGKVAGVEVKSIIKGEKYFSFLGIPYGKAPVGSRRFKAPEPHEAWTEVLPAKKEKPPCTQFNLPARHIENHGTFGQDDCLHLSIHTPKLPSGNEHLNFPVVVFLYNEHFRVSHNASRDFGPDFFVKEDVILIMISHRLGAAGFLSYEDEVLPGNNGIRDVMLALKWTQQNIPSFGGDAFSITLMGSDGGAALVDILLHSPKAKGLFSRVIMQSGTSWQPLYFPKSPKAKTDMLLKYLDRLSISSSYTLKELDGFSSAEIALAEPDAVDADESRAKQRASLLFGPVIEPEHPDAIITKLPEKGPLNIEIPVMIGYNSRESVDVSGRILQKPEYLSAADRDFLLLFPIRDDFHFVINSNIYFKAVQEMKDFYFDEGYIKISKPGEYLTYIADMMNFYPIDYTVRKYVNESSSQVYYYTFDYSGELNLRKNTVLETASTIEGTWGAAMGDELCYLFICKAIKNTYKKVLEDEESEEIKVIMNMVKMWTNFAKSGNPTPPGSDFTWTPATKENKECLVISEELKIVKNLHQDRVDFWDSYMAKYKAMADDDRVIRDEKDEL